MDKWKITYYHCRADHGDVEHAKKNGRVISAGDTLWKVPIAIGPITIEDNHWAGSYFEVEEKYIPIITNANKLYCLCQELIKNEQNKEIISLIREMVNEINNGIS